VHVLHNPKNPDHGTPNHSDIPPPLSSLVSTTAHAAIDKACEIIGCRNVKICYDPDTYQLDPKTQP